MANRKLNQKLNEYSAQFAQMRKNKLDRSISKKEKWNLKMDIEALKKELIDLQSTASELPDEYVNEICQSENYPLDDVIDNDLELNQWCDEMDEFLSDSLNIN